jgi:hypothetical protein
MPIKRVRGPMGNIVLIETRCGWPSAVNPASTPQPKPAPKPIAIVGSTSEVKLLEAIRDTYLALAEWRIALVLGTTSLQEKAAALRAQLTILEARAWQSFGAGVGLCMATKEAVAASRQVLDSGAPDPAAVSRRAKELCSVLNAATTQLPPRTDEELRARALALRARTHMQDDTFRFGIE